MLVLWNLLGLETLPGVSLFAMKELAGVDACRHVGELF